MKPKPDYYTVREESMPWEKKFETKEEAVKFARERRSMMTGMGQKGITVHAVRLKKGNSRQNYDITYKAFNGAWMTLTGRYMGRNKEEAIKIFKSKTPHGEIISIAKIDKYGMPTKPKKVGKGWHGDSIGHSLAALKAQAGSACNIPMRTKASNKTNDIWLSIRSNEMMRDTMKALIQEIKSHNIQYTSYASGNRLYLHLKNCPESFKAELGNWIYYQPVTQMKKPPNILDDDVTDW